MPRPKKIAPVEPVAPALDDHVLEDSQAEPSVAPPAPTNNRNITNCLPGTQLHLGDGRVLEFGENAEVGEELAAFLRKRGQAR